MGMSPKKKILDDERCFRLYRDTGSVYRVANLLASEGLINQSLGRPYTPQAVYLAAWRWGVTHPKDGKTYIYEVGRSRGVIFTNDELDEILDARAKYVYSKKKNGYKEYLENKIPFSI